MKQRILAVGLAIALTLSLLPTPMQADVLKTGLPEVQSSSHVTLDGDTGEVLFGKKYDQPFDPGTLVQMMTALLVIEKGNLADKVTAPPMPADINSGNTVFIRKNETFKLAKLLEGIIVYNANDAAYAAANHVGGSVDKFIEMMNAEAKALGMNHTTFKSVYGSAKGQKSTAYDMALLAARVSAIEKYVQYTMKPTMNWNGEMFAQEDIPNACAFFQVMEDGIGLKFAVDKGAEDSIMHLASSYSRGGRTVVNVLLNENAEATLYDDAQKSLEFALANTKSMRVIQKDRPLASFALNDKHEVRVAAKSNYSVTVGSATPTAIATRVALAKTTGPIKVGDTIGKVIISDGDTEIKAIPVVALDAVKRPINGWKGLAIFLLLLVIAFLLLRLWVNLSRPRRPQAKRPAQSKGSARPRPALPGRSTRKRAPKAVPPAQNAKPRPKNPSQGSDAGRQGLEQRLHERQRVIHREYPGDRG